MSSENGNQLRSHKSLWRQWTQALLDRVCQGLRQPITRQVLVSELPLTRMSRRTSAGRGVARGWP